MSHAFFRFYAELNDFLPLDRRQLNFIHHFADRASVKDCVEALGVPHPEIGLILACGISVGFDYLVRDGDRISVYPPLTSLDVGEVSRVWPGLPDGVQFVVDAHLGKLATYLRLLGFDTLYRNDYDDIQLAHVSAECQRILLTRDRGLLKRRIITYGYCVRGTDPRRQAHEVLARFNLFHSVNPFHRCLRCNGVLTQVEKATIAHRLLPKTYRYYDQFCMCGSCGQIYWKGPHYQQMVDFIQNLVEDNRGAQ
jgi:uncharacterized protein